MKVENIGESQEKSKNKLDKPDITLGLANI